MAEIVSKNLSCYRDPSDESAGYDDIRVTVRSQTKGNYLAAQMAVATLLEALPLFEPPIDTVTEANIVLRISRNNECTASYARYDQPTVGLPDGWTSDGYPLLADQG